MISDETLMAYVDGALDEDARQDVERQIAASPADAERLARHQRLVTRLRQTYDPILFEPAPAPLQRLVSPREAQVIDLAQRRAARRPSRFAWPQAGLAAACLAAGLIVGGGVSRLAPMTSGTPSVESTGGALIAQGALAQALDRQLASESRAGPVRIGLTIRTRRGTYCRTFDDAAIGSAGLACRQEGAWRLVATAQRSDEPRTDYRTAGEAMPAAVMDAAQELADGPPLDAQSEKLARSKGWRR